MGLSYFFCNLRVLDTYVHKQALFFGVISGITTLFSYSLIILNISGMVSAFAFLIVHLSVVLWLINMGWQIAFEKSEKTISLVRFKALFIPMHKALYWIYAWTLIASMTGTTALMMGFVSDPLYFISIAFTTVTSLVAIYAFLGAYNRMQSNLSLG